MRPTFHNFGNEEQTHQLLSFLENPWQLQMDNTVSLQEHPGIFP